MSPLIESKALSKHFRLDARRTVHAVDEVSLAIAPREILGLVGESGSGKSTYGKTLLGLHDKTSGEVTYKDERLPAQYKAADFARWAPHMQMIFQDPYSSLNPRMTVGEIIAEGLKLTSQPGSAKRSESVARWLEEVGLDPDHASRYPHEFSGGQRQRVGIARALILEPEFVVCDEPISALDVSVQAQVVRLLGDLKERMGLTMLFIAHDLSMVRYVSDRMAVMYMGTIVELGAADDVYFEPNHPYTQGLVASNPEPDPRTERERETHPIRGEITSPVNIGAGCRFAGRCPMVMEQCRTVTPRLTTIEPEDGRAPRKVACHLFSADK
ncbi:MAG TPA: ABC transporter ATP-binding protein [Gammaproteobacteria bacterium]|nr:ABC transporter ATP-binding protein [Gammaproteobacteria bacterium]